MSDDDALKLDRQLCFPLYAAARKMIRAYRPYLDTLGLTYTQYITILVLWERHAVTVKELGGILFLDSGTLTPLLKELEKKELVTRTRNRRDERVLDVTLTERGAALKAQAALIPGKMTSCARLSPDEAAFLHKILYVILEEAEDDA